jgi:GntR family transcriptional repressor for pyruvate dehydrogenase complex
MIKATGQAANSQLTMRVVNHIRTMIENGALHQGDRLPPERELATRLHISRSSLRAGIGFLAAMGVLKSRHGAGTFVADGPPAFNASSLNVMAALHGFNIDQMFEARIALERSLVGMAAERATDEQLAILAEEVAEMYAALGDPQEYLIHDVRFHRTIAAASGNPILAALMETVTAALYERRRIDVAGSRDMKDSADHHREIYKAIRSGNAKGARDSMENHLQSARASQIAETEPIVEPPAQQAN